MIGSMGKGKFSCADWGILVLRVAAAIIFITHGYGKLFGGMPGMEGFTGMVMRLGFPFPAFFAYVVAIVEFFGGFAILFGLLTRVVGIFGAIDMLVAFCLSSRFNVNRGGLELMMLASMIAFVLIGAGTLSLDGMFNIEKKLMKNKKMMEETPSS